MAGEVGAVRPLCRGAAPIARAGLGDARRASPKSGRKIWAQSLGRHVVTISVGTRTNVTRTCVTRSCVSPGLVFTRTCVYPDLCLTRTCVYPDLKTRTCVSRPYFARTTVGASKNYCTNINFEYQIDKNRQNPT